MIHVLAVLVPEDLFVGEGGGGGGVGGAVAGGEWGNNMWPKVNMRPLMKR